MNNSIMLKCNQQLNALTTIQKHINSPHGDNLIAISLLDLENRLLEFHMVFEDASYLEIFVDHIFAIWRDYKPISSFLRSYKKNNIYFEQFEGQVLDTQPIFPASPDDFKGKKTIIDVEVNSSNGTDYIFKLYKWNEDKPRILIAKLKDE